MNERKVEFYKSLRGKEYSITTLVKMHESTRITITKWLKQAGIEPIPDTWPPKYTLPEDFVIPTYGMDSSEPKQGNIKEAYLKHLLNPETSIDVAKLFKDVKSAEDARRLIKGLDDTLAVAHYFSHFFTEEGLI